MPATFYLSSSFLGGWVGAEALAVAEDSLVAAGFLVDLTLTSMET